MDVHTSMAIARISMDDRLRAAEAARTVRAARRARAGRQGGDRRRRSLVRSLVTGWSASGGALRRSPPTETVACQSC